MLTGFAIPQLNHVHIPVEIPEEIVVYGIQGQQSTGLKFLQ